MIARWAATAAVAEAESIIAAELAKLAALGVITVAVVAGTAGAANASPGLAGAPMAYPAVVPPLPPIPGSGAFPPYSPQQQAAAAGWAAGLQTWMPTGTGGGIWADGYRDTDGAMVDAKHVRQQGCSPRTLQGLNEQQFATRLMQPGDEDEVLRYGQAAANPANHIQYLEIDTDDPETVGYWQYLAAANHVPADVRYVP